MAEWLYEAGVGEARAALVADGAIVKARIERPGGVRVGAVLKGRLVERSAGLSRVATAVGEVLVDRLAPGVSEGGGLRVEIIREGIAETGRFKLAKGVATDAAPRDGDDLLARITASGLPVRHLAAHQPDALEAAGWSEAIEEARTGHIAFPGGALAMTPTPAMTLFDVDGTGPLDKLATAAATAIGRAIMRHGIGGSIGIDFPTLGSKEGRQAAAAALDAALADSGPFERTAVNGFGFLQVVRRRARASLPDLVRADPVATEALALLRSIERTPPPVPAYQPAPPRIAAWLVRYPDLIAELSRRVGVPISFA
ncbi:MAG: ribonuclease E/G [Sphingomonas sp.]|uniref:ribonuclease E/G n=1 Tax=Sphingomonas sp. TaxID=28214 RepID=UPI001ACF2F19|nr:ribonuclease E/G [Sphingomonas sp.]MBN8808081.1 ribonuclease E/G [Sphingomonas sp.]